MMDAGDTGIIFVVLFVSPWPISVICIVYDFIAYLANGVRIERSLRKMFEITIFLITGGYALISIVNVFLLSPDPHPIYLSALYMTAFLCFVAYLYFAETKSIKPAQADRVVNFFLGTGWALTVLCCNWVHPWFLLLLLNLPINILFAQALLWNYKKHRRPH